MASNKSTLTSSFDFLASSKIISYEKEKFSQIMKMDDIKPSEISASFHLVNNSKMIFKANQGEGKSGSFFFRSKDQKFIIKTMKGSEK